MPKLLEKVATTNFDLGRSKRMIMVPIHFQIIFMDYISYSIKLVKSVKSTVNFPHTTTHKCRKNVV